MYKTVADLEKIADELLANTVRLNRYTHLDGDIKHIISNISEELDQLLDVISRIKKKQE